MSNPVNTPRVALVTGAGKRRIGWHVADALAKRGYALAIHYRSSAAEANEAVADAQVAGCSGDCGAGGFDR